MCIRDVTCRSVSRTTLWHLCSTVPAHGTRRMSQHECTRYVVHVLLNVAMYSKLQTRIYTCIQWCDIINVHVTKKYFGCAPINYIIHAISALASAFVSSSSLIVGPTRLFTVRYRAFSVAAALGNMVNDAEQRLFHKIRYNSKHVLHVPLPPITVASQNCELRARAHNKEIPCRAATLSDSNFITRMIYNDCYWFTFLYLLLLLLSFYCTLSRYILCMITFCQFSI